MGTKKEVYYKFFFPNYNSLSTNASGNSFIPDSDGVDQKGEVRALCNKCPERVITYDQLEESNSNNLVSIYKTAWEINRPSTQPFSRTFIKKCVDKYLEFPKYFNLRNYWDSNVCQEGGMSLMVSDSPEVGGDYGGYTKFTIKENENELEKYVYCSVMISSGDFFYSFCLPSDVLGKSGLLDNIVASKFHSNWFNIDTDNCKVTIPRAIHFNNSDRIFLNNDSSKTYIEDSNYPGYPYTDLGRFKQPAIYNAVTGSEKRVFAQGYFNDFFQYGFNDIRKVVDTYSKFSEDLKRDFLELEATRRILYYDDTHNSSTQLKYTDNNNTTSYITIQSTSDIPILLDDYSLNAAVPSGTAQGLSWWSSTQAPDSNTSPTANKIPIQINVYNETTDNWEETTVYTRASFADNNCAVLRNMTKQLVTVVRENLSKIGKNTKISYEPPAVYDINQGGCPPLQIPYNLLRYCLNDRPPFTDCETVLVMWVATPYYDSNNNLITPDNISDNDVASLHKLNWQQYAIPISCRCCFKNSTDTDSFIQSHQQGSQEPHKHIHNRFLVKYPFNYWSIHDANAYATSEELSFLTYRYHTRRAESCNVTNNNEFKEVLYLQDLVRYSSNYIIVSQNTNYLNYGFDIQGYLLQNYRGAFKQLYVEKTCYSPGTGYNGTEGGNGGSNNHENQLYYIKVDETYTDEQNNTIRVFRINTDNYSLNNRRICICNPTAGSTVAFAPSNVIYRLNTMDQKWDPHGSIAPTGKVKILNKIRNFNFDDVSYYQSYGYNDWRIVDNYFFALFDVNYKVNNTKIFTKHPECQFSIINSSQLRTILGWDDIYISSLGVSPYNLVYIDAMYHHTGQGTAYHSLGILDNYIALDGVAYGSQVQTGLGAHKVIVGFENMLDFNFEDAYHFKYINGEYKPVNKIINTNYSYDVTERSNNYTCTAYIIDYND